MATVSTNKQDYVPGETVEITLVDVTLGGIYTFTIKDDPNDPGDDGIATNYGSFTAVDGGAGDLDGLVNGKIVTNWTVPTDGSANNATLDLTTTDANGNVVATTSFTDAVSANLDQWGNGQAPDADGTGAQNEGWQNGNLNANQAHFAEGEAIAYRSELDDLVTGATYAYTIQWDTVDTNAYAIDYLTGYNFTFEGTKHPLEPDPDPTVGIVDLSSGLVSTALIPSDPRLLTGFGNGITDGLSSGQPSGAQSITAFGSVSGLSVSTVSYNGDLSKASVTITFTYTGSTNDNSDAVVLAWGGHIASSLDWRDDQGETVQTASDISGSPYHMRHLTLTENGVTLGLGNQDRSLSAAAVEPPPIPDFTITKVVADILNPDNSDGGTTVNQVGDKIVYTITVDNTGNVNLTGVTVDDAVEGGTATPATYVSGDANTDNILQTTETWIYTASYTVSQNDIDTLGAFGNGTSGIQNTATADTDQTGPKTASAEVPASSIEQSKILHIEKDADKASVSLTSDVITYTMLVTNTGNAAIANVVVDDPTLTNEAPVLAGGFNAGDTDTDNLLDVSETWQYTGTRAVTQADLDAGVDLVNTATATGDGATPDSDDATVDVVQTPGITIDKVTVEGSTSGDGLNILSGEAISWRYTVANTGNVTLTTVAVTDSESGVTPAYVSGDGGVIGALEVGETWVYEATGTAVTGNYSNTGTVVGDYSGGSTSASDDSNYFGADPQIAINKVTVAGSTSGDALNILAGSPITWQYSVTNAGNVALSSVAVTDSVSGVTPAYVSGDGGVIGDLEVGETWIYEASGTAIAGDYSNIGTASGSYTDSAGHTAIDSATDPSSYTGYVPGVCGLTPGFWSQHLWAWDGNASTDGQVDNQGKTLASKLVADDVLTFEDVLIPVDSNRDGVIDGSDQAGVLVGDINHDGITNNGEITLFFELVDAQALINASQSQINADQRVKMSRDAIALQLNINNEVVDPDDLITEAAKWLTAQSPYTYGNNKPTGDVDTTDDGIADYTTKFAGTAIKASNDAWQQLKNGYSGSTIHEAIDDFNNCRLVGGTDVSGAEFIGATLDDIVLLGVSSNTSIADWQTVNGWV